VHTLGLTYRFTCFKDGEVYSDEEEEEEEAEKNSSPKPELSLIFNFSDRQLDELPWKFGHPTDSTHGRNKVILFFTVQIIYRELT